MVGTADIERVAPQWSKQNKDKQGTHKYRVARIDVVATIPGTIRRPTAATNVQGAAKQCGFSVLQGEKEKTKQYRNRNEIGETVKPISFELGGRPEPQTITVLQGLRTKLAEARGGELNAATALR